MTAPTPFGQHRRIALVTYGTRGDVEPFVALGVGLRRAGHTAHILAPAPFEPLAQAHGLDFSRLVGDPDQLALAMTDRAGLSWPQMIARMIQHVLPLATAALRTVERRTRDADLIIHSFLMTDAAHTVARMRAIPDISAQLFPVFLATSQIPAVALPDLPLGGLYRRATHALNTAVFRIGGRLLHRKVRAVAPDLPDLAPWPFGRRHGRPTPILLAYSPHILPRPSDWPAHAHVTGYWHLRPPEGWVPPEPLARFLEAGPPPVYFGVGSTRSQRMRDLVRTATDVILSSGQRAVLNVPREALDGTFDASRLFHVEGIPHEWLFPRMRFIIHHGGAGTTGAALRAGVPSTALPFTADQSFWACRIHRLGVGPAAPPAHKVTSSQLASIIEQALARPSFRTCAQSLGEQVRREDGVGTAIRLIHEHLGLPSGDAEAPAA